MDSGKGDVMRHCEVTFDDLVAYAEGDTPEADGARVRQHLDTGCTECVDDLKWINRAVAALKTPKLVHAPPSAVASAVATFEERNRRPGVALWVARLVFDSWSALSPARTRGDATSRRQVFATPWHDVDLWGERQAGDTWYVIGQVLPHQGGAPILPEDIALLADGTDPISGIPEAGEFHIPSVRSGEYKLQLRLGDAEVVVPGVHIGI